MSDDLTLGEQAFPETAPVFDPKAFVSEAEGFDPLANIRSSQEDNKTVWKPFAGEGVKHDDVVKDTVDAIVQVQNAKVGSEEPAPPPAPEKEKHADEIADKWEENFNRLTRMEAKLRTEKQELKSKEADLQELAAFREELARDPARAIARLGVSPDSIFAEHAKEEAQKPQRELEELKNELRREIQELKQTHHRSEMERKGDAWDAQFGVEFNSPDYAVVKAWDPQGELVRQHVVEHYKESGEILTPTQALGIIKQELASKVEALKKAGIFGQTGEPADTRSKGVKAQPKTITSTSDEYPAKRAPYLDDDADMARLIAKFARLS